MTKQVVTKLCFTLLLLSMLLGTLTSAQTTLRLAWWGGDARHEMYNRLADMYEAQHPDIKLEREFAGWGPYWERLTTQTAGGNPPDIVHMHQTLVGEYASRGVLADLRPYIDSGVINLSDFSEGIIDTGKIGEAVYMITLGNSAPGTHYNTRLFKEAGIEVPAFDWTWSDFEATAIALSDTLGPDVYGVDDAGAWSPTVELFMRQKGKELFIDGQLGFSKEDLIELWNIWQRLREAGAIPPAEMTVEYTGASHPDSLLVRNRIAMHFMSGNQHKLFQAHTEDLLGLSTLPRSNDADAPYGDTIGGAYISMASRTQHPEEAAAFINWFINDLEVARIYNAEHGPPGSLKVQELIAKDLNPADVRLAEMMNFIAQKSQAYDVLPPKAGEVMAALGRSYQELAFGRYSSVEEAVDAFFDEADFILF